MQTIIIAGNIGKDAELRRTQSGDPICGFSVAVSEGRDKPTTWWDCTLWGKRGERLCQYLTKGSKVTVSGEFSTREHNGKTYLQCRVDQIALQGGGKPSEGQQQPSQGGYGGGWPGQDIDDEIMF